MSGLVAHLGLLEREQELALVGELIDRTTAGEFGVAVVQGPAGAGKSALLGELSARASKSGIRVLRAVGLEFERGYPFGVARQLFEPVVARLEQPLREELFGGAA